jgi:predicted component of type VI protein secretion system
VEGLWPRLVPRLERDAVLLLKASRGVQLERLLPSIEQWAASGDGDAAVAPSQLQRTLHT